MYCGKCGTPTPDGQEYCEACKQASSRPVQQPSAANEAQRTNDPTFASFGQFKEQPVFEVNRPTRKTNSREAKKSKGGKSKKPLLIVVSLVLVAAIVLSVVFWGKITRFYQRNFGDPTAYLQDVEKENVATAASEIATVYDNALKTSTIENPSADCSLTFEVSETLIALLESALANEGMDMDLSWVHSITLSPRVDMYGNTFRYNIGVGLNGISLVTVDIIWDMESSAVYIGIPELNSTYISSSFSDGNFGVSVPTQSLSMLRAMSRDLTDCLPSSEELQELIEKYAGIVIDGLSDAEKEKRSVELDGLEQDLLVVSVDLSQKDILNILIDVLEEAQDDRMIENLLLDLDSSLSAYTGYPLDLYDGFSYGVENALEGLESGMDYVERGTFLTIDTYLDNKDNVVGRTLTMKQSGEKLSVSYITVTEDDEWVFEADAGELYISGEGTVNGDATSGSYTVSVSGTDYLTVELDDVVFSGSTLTGTVRIIPDSMVYEMAGLTGPYSSLLNQAALALTFSEKSCTVAIETAGTVFAALTVSGDVSEARPIGIPASIDVNNNDAGMKWVSELDLNALLNNLRNAGVPSTYMDAAEQLVDMFFDQF